ncbi:MAG: UDP-N-acetylglucosamine 2-epimerase, partial [Limnochordaceae bacterium]|nr:UDP-N-acetylglucosamine 2-epimerase [Limnochordaceae bacterium]
APSLHTPVVLARQVSERPEGVEAGTVHLAGNDYPGIRRVLDRLLADPEAWRRSAEASNPFGDGRAAERIAQARGVEALGDHGAAGRLPDRVVIAAGWESASAWGRKPPAGKENSKQRLNKM